MQQLGTYAIVAYVRDPVGPLVESLQRELQPEKPHQPAHVTILPPRSLRGNESQALESLEAICRNVQPFEVELGDVETFLPITPTVFIRVAHAAYRMRDLHDQLNAGVLSYEEPWPYMPHLTICKLDEDDRARAVARIARERWAEYRDRRSVRLEELTFVRQADTNSWVDLAPVPLGRTLALR